MYKRITKLIQLSKDFKYEKCGEISNYLAYTSLIFQSKLLTFISEFLIYMFENLEFAEIKKEDKDSKTINKEVINFLEELKKIDIIKIDDKNKIIELMMDIRYKVSKFQVNTETTDKSLLK